METVFRADERTNTMYTESEYTALRQQMKKRWMLIGIPGALLIACLVAALILRSEILANAATISLSVLLIAGYDFAIKPLRCYARHIHSALHGRVREVELPFSGISEDVNLVDGVACRSMTCVDYDAKGRPYDRLFYFDSEKTFPDIKAGEMIRVVHYDLTVADIIRA